MAHVRSFCSPRQFLNTKPMYIIEELSSTLVAVCHDVTPPLFFVTVPCIQSCMSVWLHSNGVSSPGDLVVVL